MPISASGACDSYHAAAGLNTPNEGYGVPIEDRDLSVAVSTIPFAASTLIPPALSSMLRFGMADMPARNVLMVYPRFVADSFFSFRGAKPRGESGAHGRVASLASDDSLPWRSMITWTLVFFVYSGSGMMIQSSITRYSSQAECNKAGSTWMTNEKNKLKGYYCVSLKIKSGPRR